MSSLVLLMIVSLSLHACQGCRLIISNNKQDHVVEKMTSMLPGDEPAAKVVSLMDKRRAAVEEKAQEINNIASSSSSGVRVSWYSSSKHIKGRRRHPEIDVDYVGPRTHPPSHN